MELCEESLEDYVEKRDRISEKEAAVFILQLARALEYCHEHDVIHRDIKLENILIGQDKKLKLIDFGLSANQDTTYKRGEIVGTAYYISPEMAEGRG